MAALTRETLTSLLGSAISPAPETVETEVLRRFDHDGVEGEALMIHCGQRRVPAARLLPPGNASGTGSAVLYCHAHGNRYDIGKAELLDGRPALQDPPLGLWLARQGHVVLCADMPGFGERQAEGPETALAKAALWNGRTLCGAMMADTALAHRALLAMDRVDSGRIATVGFSMGATLAYWYAALEPSIAAAAHMCAFANIAPLIETGAHDLHGIYMTVPGLLREHDMADVAALVAPRPQFAASGLKDPLTPPDALYPALDRLRETYAALDAAGKLWIETNCETAHAETPAMRERLGAFLAEALR